MIRALSETAACAWPPPDGGQKEIQKVPDIAIPISYTLAIHVAEQGCLQVVGTGLEFEQDWGQRWQETESEYPERRRRQWQGVSLIHRAP